MTPTLAHAIAVLLLTGIIWTIQLVHYPGFPDIEKRRWPDYHKRHKRHMPFIVLPPMLAEIGTSGWLVWTDLNALHAAFLALALFTWVITALLFIPLHQRITFRPTERNLARLTGLNWLRTLAWTASSVLSVISIM